MKKVIFMLGIVLILMGCKQKEIVFTEERIMFQMVPPNDLEEERYFLLPYVILDFNENYCQFSYDPTSSVNGAPTEYELKDNILTIYHFGEVSKFKVINETTIEYLGDVVKVNDEKLAILITKGTRFVAE